MSIKNINTDGEVLNAVSFFDENFGLAVGKNIILKTLDGGHNWSLLNNGVVSSFQLNDIKFYSVNSAIAVGSDGLILKTEKLGETWIKVGSGTSTSLNLLSQIKPNQLVIAGDYGIIMKQSKVSENFILSGNVTYSGAKNSFPVQNVGVKLSPTHGGADQITFTNSSGFYAFHPLPKNSYSINFSKTSDWGGVNATDAYLIARHDVGLDNLTGLALKAGDVNNSGVTNSADALLILRRFVGLDNQFPNGMSDWVFSLNNQEINFQSNEHTINVLTLAAGDVNRSYEYSPLLKNPSIVFEKHTGLTEDSKPFYSIPVLIDNYKKIGALSLTIFYPDDRFKFEEILVNNENENLFVNADDNKINIAWTDISGGKKPFVMNRGNELFKLNFSLSSKKVDNFHIGLHLSDASEIVDEHGNRIEGIKLVYISPASNLPEEFELSQNFPNPFNASTKIKYTLPEAAEVKLIIYNLLGKELVRLVNAYQFSGHYEVNFSAGSFGDASDFSSGIYIYKITAKGAKNSFDKARAMVILK